jgi:hypothetical protein
MGTPFISFLGPSNLDGYDRKRRPSQQPDNIPKTFLDAMEVREQVFVEEQGVPLDNEFDSDDPRACHWVCTASVIRTPIDFVIRSFTPPSIPPPNLKSKTLMAKSWPESKALPKACPLAPSDSSHSLIHPTQNQALPMPQTLSKQDQHRIILLHTLSTDRPHSTTGRSHTSKLEGLQF